MSKVPSPSIAFCSVLINLENCSAFRPSHTAKFHTALICPAHIVPIRVLPILPVRPLPVFRSRRLLASVTSVSCQGCIHDDPRVSSRRSRRLSALHGALLEGRLHTVVTQCHHGASSGPDTDCNSTADNLYPAAPRAQTPLRTHTLAPGAYCLL